MRRREALRTALVSGTGVSAYAFACGRGHESDGASRTIPTENVPSGQPRQGGVIVQRLPSDPDRLDLHQSTIYPSIWSTAPCFNQLVQYDPSKPGDTPQDIIGDLATQWEQPDASTLIFGLRRGVRFHDNSEFSAEDAKVQLDWIRNPTPKKVSPRRGTLGTIAGIEVPDPGTLRIDLSRPTPSLLANLAGHHFTIGQARDIILNGEVGPKLIGTGPFKLNRYDRAELIELEKNPSYHVPGHPHLDGLRFHIVPELSTALANFIAGHYQLFYDVQLTVSHQEEIRRALGDRVETPLVATTQRDIIFINARRRPFDDIRVRQAISLALDRDAALTVVKQGAGRRGGFMVPNGVWSIAERELRVLPGYDRPNIGRAKQLLEQAGVSTPIDAECTTRTDYKDLAEFVKDGLAKIGINLKLTIADAAAAQPAMQRGDFDISPWVIGITVDDPDATFSEIATRTAVRNWSAVFDAQVDALFERQSQTLELDERRMLVQELEKRALAQYGVAVLYFQDASFAQYRSVRDFSFHQSQSTNRRMESVWLQPS